MNVVINGREQALPPAPDGGRGVTVAAMLTHLKLDGQPCAVEVNRQLVPKRRHAEHVLAAGDVVEVVTLVGGG